jgi:hypothetical protein
MKINKKSRRSFVPSSKSIISNESENYNNFNDISNITSNHKTDDLNVMNNSLYSTNSFNIPNTNKFILNDNIIEQNAQVIKELAS